MNSNSADARIIHGRDSLQVMPRRFEVMWRDGSTVALHLVSVNGNAEPDTFLRALQVDGGHWVYFDLRDVSKALDAEIRSNLPRDVPGLVFYTLRLAYPNAGAFTVAAMQVSKAMWYAGAAEALAA